MDLFIRQTDGKKVVDPKQQTALCFHLKEEMLHPLRVMFTNRGPDTELLVANPVELCGKGRPRVFYDVTLALKALGICIFSVRIDDLIYVLAYAVLLPNFLCDSAVLSLVYRLKLEGIPLPTDSGKFTGSFWMKV